MKGRKKTFKQWLVFSVFVIVSFFGILADAENEEGKITLTKEATKDYQKIVEIDSNAINQNENNPEYGRLTRVDLKIQANPYTETTVTTSQLDIVVVMDGSGSMAYGANGEGSSGPSRLSSAKDATKEFIDAIMDDTGNVQVGLVEFAGDKTVRSSHGMTTDKDSALDYVDDLRANGGTNLQSGIKEARTILDRDGREGAKKIVIIITDGIPTYFTYTNNNGRTYLKGFGYNDDAVCLSGSSNNSTDCRNNNKKSPSQAAKEELDGLKEAYNDADIYTITFGNEDEAARKLATINPQETTSKHIYENSRALDGNALKEKFQNIVSQAKSVIANNAVVTDTIPANFKLTESSKEQLIEQGVEVTENSDGTTTLVWKSDTIEANKDLTLSYVVEANKEYHGSMYTNEKATLTADKYDGTKVEEDFPTPTVDIPVVTEDDHYSKNPSYEKYEGQIIYGETVLTNDHSALVNIEKDQYDKNVTVKVTDEVIVETKDGTVVPNDNGSYSIYKEGVLQGTLTMNSNEGTFTFVPEEGITGEVEFTYYVKSTVERKVNSLTDSEKSYVYSNSSKVTLNLKEHEKITINGLKTWVDNNNQDGKRPESITIRLLANGIEVASKEVTADDNWAYEFKDVREFDDEHEQVQYTIIEDTVEGYTTTVNGYDVTNTHTPEVTTIRGVKTWDDNNNQDGMRPEVITVRLLANGEVVRSVNVTEKENWTYAFSNLPVYENGEKITYTVREDKVTGYTTEIIGYGITNTHIPEVTTIRGLKTWDDNNNQDGIRPTSIIVNLFADGEQVSSKNVTASNDWSYEFTDLPVYKNGNRIVYTITEEDVVGYTTIIDGTNITNIHVPELIEISGVKTWEDKNNQDGIRPESITVRLYANGEEVNHKVVTESDHWTYAFTSLDKYKDGVEIIYTVREDVVAGYTTTIDGTNITNTHETEKTSVRGAKTWEDKDNQDGVRPESITVRLYANGEEVASKTVTETDNWSYSFENLDKYKAGVEITYTVREDKVEGYTTTIDGTNITNTHETEKTSVHGIKTWDDNNNQDGMRPESIIVRLYANGEEVASKTVTETDNWSYTFADLDKYKAGVEITYTVREDNVEGYTTTINGTNITNTHEIEKTLVRGEKTWDDNNNQDGMRPTSITVHLLANGEVVQTVTVREEDNWTYTFTDLDKYKDGKEIVYTVREDLVAEYTTTIDGTNIINTHIPEVTSVRGEKIWDDNNNQDGVRPELITVNLLANGKVVQTVTVREKDNWTYTFDKLPVYENGKKINYTVCEDSVEGYTTTTNGTNITNTHIPEVTSVRGEKTWDDNNNQDGMRPESITVRLYANGVEVDSKVVTENDHWSYEFTNLDKYSNGEKIVYTVTEDKVENYETTINGTDITNTHEPFVTKVEGIKTWDDNNNQDGMRPESITVNLFANGMKIISKVVDSSSDWKYEFSNLPVYANGEEIVYTVTEDKVENYETTIDGFHITNTHTIEKISVSGTKTWDDNNNQDGKRPESITIRLYANGKEIDSKVVTENDHWSYEFANLDKYSNGEEIIYTVTEDKVENYSTKVNGYNVTNIHETENTSVYGTKIWDDNNNQDGMRPESIIVRLLANGEVIDSVIVTEENNWTYSFENLDKYKDGVEITYTVTEDEVANYTTTINGYNITNTHETEKTSVRGMKTWDDNNNQDGMRPESITIHLFANGEKVDSKIVTVSDNWTYEFTNLDKYKDGVEITYTVTEDAVSQYSGRVNGYDITNTHTPETIRINGSKTWLDNNNQDGIRPESITVRLYANGVEVASTEATEASNWTYTFTDLAKYESGSEITYMVREDRVLGYTSEVNGYDITNTHETETVSVNGLKTWEDKNNQDGIRPTSITIRLYANGEEIASRVVTEKDNWAYEFANLDKYKDGVEIKYTVSEDSVEGYTTTINGTNITNTHITETTSVHGSKTWEDNNNQDGMRPESITVRLYADGVEVATKTVTESGNWTYEFTNLDKYKEGKIITYTVTEDEVANYTGQVDGTNITNTHTPITLNIQGEKKWVDKDNFDGLRPESVTINLIAEVDGTIISTTPVVVTEESNWTYEFNDLPKYKDGKEINYYVEEEAVEHYETSYVDKFIVVNTHNPKDIEVSGTKTWDDKDNRYGHQESITVRLTGKVGEQVVVSESRVVTSLDEWKYSFTGLPEYRDGKLISYTVSEDAVKDYDTTIDGFNIINTYNPETLDITGMKTWDDNDNQDGIRPESITVNLLANGEVVATTTTNEENNWEFSFTNQVVYANGEKIEYTVEEVSVDGYTTEINNFEITNIHTPEVVSFKVSKLWDDNNNQDGVRPESITVNLYADDELIDTQIITEENGWVYEFINLPKYKAGQLINYEIVEEEVNGYVSNIETSISENDNNNTVVITNTHEIEKINITVNKIWEDQDNKFNTRPDEITVHLYADEELIDTVKITREGNWTYTFEGLDKFKDGKEIIYTISEDSIFPYLTEYDGFNIINTLESIGDVGEPEITPPHTGVDSVNNTNNSMIGFLSMIFTISTCMYFSKKEQF